jgi:hypothetical protein
MVANLEQKTPNAKGLEGRDWDILLRHISKGKCTPFIGPEACAGLYPTKSDRAQKWCDDEDYPLEDRSELARVAQFLAIRDYPAKPIERLVEEFEKLQSPNFNDPYEVHSVLADLPLKAYVTTNYDDFMMKALGEKRRDAKSEYCHWRDGANRNGSSLSGEYRPTPANPVVFHLYGKIDEERSLVLTENDYLQFLVNVTREEKLIPPVIQGEITGGSLLFLGYQLDEWDFRVLFHVLQNYLESALTKAHISVQLVPMVKPPTEEQVEKATTYLNSYFEKQLYTRVYWGTCQEFVKELKQRWEASSYAKQ